MKTITLDQAKKQLEEFILTKIRFYGEMKDKIKEYCRYLNSL